MVNEQITGKNTMKTKNDKEKITKVVQGAIDKGATTAEEIHRSIADLPIKVLKNMGVAEETTSNVKEFHDTTIGAIYELVHEINHQVTDLAGDLIDAGKAVTKNATKEEKEEV